jgi:Flp pilus assembly protein CpaB
MEMEYKDPSRRGRWIVLLGVVLAIAAGAAAFYTLNNAQQQAGTSGLKTIKAYVAKQAIPAKKLIADADLALREDIPLDATNAGAIADKAQLIGHMVAIDIPVGQVITPNMLSSGTAGLSFQILKPDETVAPDSEAWRAVSITVPDDRAVGGVLAAGMHVDIFLSAEVTVPEIAAVPATPDATPVAGISLLSNYESGTSTKITYQDVTVLSRAGSFYILKVPLLVAEEISHLQDKGATPFSLALRPDQDKRVLDVSGFGATTNRIVQRYGILIPQPYPTLNGPKPSIPPIPALTPPPSGEPADTSGVPASPGATAAPTAPAASPAGG